MKRILVLILIGLIGVFGLSSCVGGVSPEHTHTEEVIPGFDATCTEAGLTEGKKCSECGEILVAQEEIPAKGHSYVDGKCECGADDPNYKKDINLREVYNIFNTINIVKTATDEEIKNIVNKWNDNLYGKIEGKLQIEEGDEIMESTYDIEYDFSSDNLNNVTLSVLAIMAEEQYEIVLENMICNYYYNGNFSDSVSFEEYDNLNNREFKNKVITEMYIFYDHFYEEFILLIEHYTDQTLINIFKDLNSLEIEQVGYDENGYLVIDCKFYPDENYLKGRFVSDNNGNLLYAETVVINEETGIAYNEGCYYTFTYEK